MEETMISRILERVNLELEVNVQNLIILGALGWLLVTYTSLELPSLSSVPLWARVTGVFLGAGLAGGWLLGKHILKPPEPDWVDIFEVNADGQAGTVLEHYQLTPDHFEEMDVYGGQLRQVPNRAKAYAARYYDPEENVAHVTWAGVPTDGDLLGMRSGQILSEIDTMREMYDEEVRYYDAIRQGLPAVIRALEFDRARNLNRALEEHVAPNVSGRSIEELINERIPREALPERMREELEDDSTEGGSVEILEYGDDPEATQEVADTLEEELPEL